MTISLILALSENNTLGNKGKIPWVIPSDFKHFKNLTLGNSVIMGRKTFESIKTPLKERQIIVVTRDQKFNASNCTIVHSIKGALNAADHEKVFIAGGAEIYDQFENIASYIYLTRVHSDYDGDTSFKIKSQTWEKLSEERHPKHGLNGDDYSFIVYHKK